MMLPKIKILSSKGCAWRALYLNVNDRQVAHLSVDPNNGSKPEMSGSLSPPMGEHEIRYEFRVPLPTLHWRSNASPGYLRAYRAVRMFWHKVDGRYS